MREDGDLEEEMYMGELDGLLQLQLWESLLPQSSFVWVEAEAEASS